MQYGFLISHSCFHGSSNQDTNLLEDEDYTVVTFVFVDKFVSKMHYFLLSTVPSWRNKDLKCLQTKSHSEGFEFLFIYLLIFIFFFGGGNPQERKTCSSESLLYWNRILFTRPESK